MAIAVVDELLELFPDETICVYHEIVHNRHVVDRFRAQGVIFVESIDEAPDRARSWSSAPTGSARRSGPRPPSGGSSPSTPPARWSPRSTPRRSATPERGWQILLDRPRRPPGGDRHPGRGARFDPDRRDARGRIPHLEIDDPGEGGLPHPDHALHRRRRTSSSMPHRRRRSRPSRPRRARTSATPRPTARTPCGRSRRTATSFWWSAAATARTASG